MTAINTRRQRQAAVIFATRFGTTERVARAIEHGLQEADLEARCQSTEAFDPSSLTGYDLICVGGPTEMFGATGPVKGFLEAMKSVNLAGKLGFAFDTKLDSRLSGSAAKYIEQSLDRQGLRMAAPRESALVTNQKEGGKVIGAELRPGEEERFEELARRIGRLATDEDPRQANDERQA